jgi:nucleoside-diphosphate-sugar epimerase
MEALVTGATGFIGSHLVAALLREGFRVRVLLRRQSQLRWLEGLEVVPCYGDCTEAQSLAEAVKGVQYIFHVAGLISAPRVEDFYLVNAQGTDNLLRAALEHAPGLRRFLYLSSLAAAGPSENGAAVDEQSPPRPVSHYGRSKLQGEQAVLARGLPAVVLRPPVVYGPRDRGLQVFFRLAQKGLFPYWGQSVYSMLYVDDLVEALILAATREGLQGRVYFVSDGPYSSREIWEALADALGRRPLRVPTPLGLLRLLSPLLREEMLSKDKLRELAHRHWVCSSERARAELGFRPRVKLKEGMKWTADWYRIHQWL